MVVLLSMNSLGKKLKAIRLSKGMSQEELAHELELSLSTYSKIERDLSDVPYSSLLKMAKVFKIDLTDMLTYGSDKHPANDYKKLIEEKDKEIMSLQKQLIEALKKNK